MSDAISPRDFQEAEGVEDWRVVGDGGCAFFPITSFADSARFVAAIAMLDGVEAHRPRVDIRDDGVTIRLLTVDSDRYGMSRRDADLARRISEVARDLGLAADPAGVQSVLVIPGAPDTAAVMPFWQAVLGYERRPDSPDEDLVDPRDRGPGFWFEPMDEPRPGGGGAIHIAVWVPAELANARRRGPRGRRPSRPRRQRTGLVDARGRCGQRGRRRERAAARIAGFSGSARSDSVGAGTRPTPPSNA